MFSESSAFHVLTPDPAPAPDLAEFLCSSLEWQNDVLPSWCPAQVEALDIKTMARMKGRFAESPNLQVSMDISLIFLCDLSPIHQALNQNC